MKGIHGLLLTLAAITLLVWRPALAQDPALTLPEEADVRVVVDISGSMKDTDPDNLRRPAVRLIARMLPEGASAGLWTFGQYVNMLVPHDTVNQQWRDTMVSKSEQINSVALYTNLGLAIEKASDDWLSEGTLENTHLILLSDGKVDIPDGDEDSRAEEQRILNELVQDLADQGLTIHTVGLSEQADIEFLRELARETGGSFRLAQSAEALNLAFANALNTAVPQEQVPIEGNGFTVDDGVSEFTALIFSGKEADQATALELAKPGGEPFAMAGAPDNVRWASEPGYDLITVSNPEAGEWRLIGELGQGSRVTVVSDLRMAVKDIPAEFSEEDPFAVEVAFYEDSEKLVDPDFLGVMDVTLSITAADGRRGAKELSPEGPPDDGVYRDTVTRLPQPGRYDIEVVADGETFSRKFSAVTSFVVPGEDAPVPMVSEPLVPDLSQQVQDPGLVGEPPVEESDEPDPEAGMAEEAEQEANEPAPAEPEPEPEAPEPIVTEQPAEVAPMTPENEPVLPMWMLAAGGGAVVLLLAGGLFAWRRKKKRAEQSEAEAANRETVDDLPDDDVPVVEPEAVEEDTPEEPEPEPEEDPAEELLAQETEAEQDQAIPEVNETVPDEAGESPVESEIPVADDAVTEAEDQSESDDTAENGDSDDSETPDADAAAEEDDDDEFGLEDFDLSEFDDLPDYENEFDEPDSDEGKSDESDADDDKADKKP